jgi:AraC-like DNA-binding protein
MKTKNFFSYIRSLFGKKKRSKRIEGQLSRESIEELKSRLNALMVEEKPFLQKGYHMKEMADDLQIPVYQLSAFINQVMGMHFTDYMNKLRISYCENLIKTGHAAKLTLTELSYKCGFNNRNSFAAAFKKFTHQRPSDYMKNL